MRFAICNDTFRDWAFERACAYAAKLGYEGIEIAPFTLATSVSEIGSNQRALAKQQAAAAGLEVIGLHWLLANTKGCHLTSPEANVRDDTSRYLSDLAGLCRDLGGHVLVLGSPPQRNLLPDVTLQDGTEYAIDVITKSLPAFEECDVTLAIEPLGTAEGNFWTTANEAILTIKRIQSPHVRLHLDVKAMSAEAKPVTEIIRDSAQHLAHFHANDPNRRGPGMGNVDFLPIFAALREIGYDGWVSVEVFDYDPGVEQLAAESIRYMQDCLQRLF